MSLETREWAWQVPDLLPSARLLLLALAEHVSEGTICFPGQSRLAAMCGVSDRQVRSLLRDLTARGLITVEHRPGQGRGRKSRGGRRPGCSKQTTKRAVRATERGRTFRPLGLKAVSYTHLRAHET